MVKKLSIIGLIWIALIFFLCSIPGNSLPAEPGIPYFDKLVHAGLYFFMTIFILPVLDLSRNIIIRKTSVFIVILITAAYGGFIEIAQEHWFVNRSGDIKDFLSDIAGSILGIAFYHLILKKILRLNFKKYTE
jgi:VanZ family protein